MSLTSPIFNAKAASARQNLQIQSLRELLQAPKVLVGSTKKKRKMNRSKGKKPIKTGTGTKAITKSSGFQYGHMKPSIKATMKLSYDGKCGLSKGKNGKTAGKEVFKQYRPGMYLEQFLSETRKKKEAEKRESEKKEKKKQVTSEETVRRRIIGDTKKK